MVHLWLLFPFQSRSERRTRNRSRRSSGRACRHTWYVDTSPTGTAGPGCRTSAPCLKWSRRPHFRGSTPSTVPGSRCHRPQTRRSAVEIRRRLPNTSRPGECFCVSTYHHIDDHTSYRCWLKTYHQFTWKLKSILPTSHMAGGQSPPAGTAGPGAQPR